jgi:hypothetical protein
VAVAMIGVMVPNTFAHHYSEINIQNAKTHVIENEKNNIIRISLTIENDSSQQFDPWYGYLTKNYVAYYELMKSYHSDVYLRDTCPGANVDVGPELEEDYILCFKVPKSISSNFRLVFMDYSSDRCLEKAESTNPYTDQCEKTSFHPSVIPNGKKMTWDQYLQTTYEIDTKEQKAAEQRAAEQRAAEQRAAEQRAAEQKAAEQRAAEQRAEAAIRAAEQRAAEQKAAQSESITWDGAPNAKEIESDSIIVDDSICGSGTIMKDGKCIAVNSSEKGGGCLIATATYGSEMATEVQQLRELRDNQLLNTESGTAFMGTFNDIYYSFSPIIADYERENSMFKEAVKLAITPMISTLSLMENAESESEVLSIGISVIMLNLGMYLGVPAVVIVGIRKRF